MTRVAGIAHHVTGPEDGPPLVLAHGLGMDRRIWAEIAPLLPPRLRVIAYDLRGHGQSDCPAPPYAMGALIRDAETLLDALGVRGCVVLGLGLGGMVAQGLAVKRLDLVRALILTGSATRFGPPDPWMDRAEAVMAGGMVAIVEAELARWSPRHDREAARDMLLSQQPQGYAGACTAIAGTDLHTPTSGLRLPTLGIAGSEDRAIPPDMLRETLGLVPGSRFHLLRGGGHLSCLDRPDAFAEATNRFLKEIAHV